MNPGELAIAGVALVAATVTGALGYGFSSITVPAALLVYTGRVLNPALVLVEAFMNGVALWTNRRSLRSVWPRMKPLLAGVVPGAIAGSLLLACTDSGRLKVFTFTVLLPLILLQSAGVRRPIRRERAAAIPAGVALGALYGATTISGPPLALMFNNQGLTKDEFRSALSIFRLAESLCTLVAYLALGLFTREALTVAATLAPSAAIGIPLGYLALRSIAPEPFRRACMATDVLLVGFGLARTLVDLHLASAAVAYAGFAAIVCIEASIVAAFVLGRLRRPAVEVATR